MLALAGCSSAPEAPDVELMHVHGLAYEGGNLLVATHQGLVRGTQAGGEWGWAYASEDRYDYMGFAGDGRGTFYSSGHPDDPRAYGGVNLGLRRSTDGGQVWEQRSLKGQTDFHAMAVMPGTDDLVAYWRGSLMESADGGATWTNTTPPPTGNVLALAASQDRLWAGGLDGVYVREAGAWARRDVAGAAASLAVSDDGQVLWLSQLAQASGAAWTSDDAGMTWRKAVGHDVLERVRAPVLFAIDQQDARHVFASDAGGKVIESSDGGGTWTTIRPSRD